MTGGSHRHLSRTLLAAILTALAVAVPSAIWYVAGSRAAGREASELERAARESARYEALRLAERLAGRLEAIRYAESRRPAYQYEHVYHDPTSSCACASVTPSPLAHGPHDPLILAHFQIERNEAGTRLTMPTVHGPGGGVLLPPGTDRRWEAEQIAIANQLSGETMRLTAALDAPVDGESAPPDPSEMEWRTVGLGGELELVAMRRVPAARGDLIQGILIEPTALRDLVRGSRYPAHITAEDLPSAESERSAVVPIECVTWRVTVDAEEEIAAARNRGQAAMAAFRKSFLFGTGTAVVAGLCVIGLVWQTERLARQRSRFAAAAAHELRTPLSGLRLQAEMLAEGLGDPGQARSYARSLAAEAERLGRVVGNVLDYARLERSALTVHPKPGDLTAAVEECLARLSPTLEEAGARVELRANKDLPPVAFDRDALFHILQNLLDNAEKYSRDSGDRRIHVEVGPAGSRAVALTVADHGPGVPPATRRHLFQPFRGEIDPNAPAGLGLGLALVASLARAHGGDVRLADTPGGGASFTVTLPS